MKVASLNKGRAWIELNIGCLRNNVEIIKKILPDNCELMPSVKANAHGHGAAEICRELNKIGIRAFCVASVMEGAELRKQHIKGDILIFGYTHPDHFDLLKRYDLIQTVVDCEYAEKLNAYGKKLFVHLKIDTGMNRLGEPSENKKGILRILGCKNLIVAGVYSHFSAQKIDDPTHKDFTQEQLDKFNHVLSAIEKYGYRKPKTHLQGSFGIFGRPDLDCDYARPGMAIYGVYRNGNPEAGENKLRPVLSLKTRVASVKTIHEGDAVGYELAFVASRDMKIAALSIGYADGLPRALSCGKGRALVDGTFAPILGNICMDQTIIDVTGIENIKQGDTAVIIGKDGGAEISVYDIAEQAGTIPNEIVGRLGSRLERCII